MKHIGFLLIVLVSIVNAQSENLIPYRKGDLWGFCTPDKKIVIPCKYNEVDFFTENLAPVKLNNNWGFIDASGKVVIPFQYDVAYTFVEGLAKVSKNQLWGFIDKTGKEIVPCIYEVVYNFHEGLAAVQNNEGIGFVNKQGKLVIPTIYDKNYYPQFKEGLVWVSQNQQCGFIDKTGKVVIPLKYDHPGEGRIFGGDFQKNGLAWVYKNEKYGVIDKKGNLVVPLKYELIKDFKNGLAIVRLNNKYGFINSKGVEVIPCQYHDVNEWGFNEGYCLVRLSDAPYTQAIIDTLGKVVYQFPKGLDVNINRFVSNGLLPVYKYYEKGGVNYKTYGYMNVKGEMVIPFQEFVEAKSFQDGVAWVQSRDRKWGLINKSGKMITPCKYDDLEYGHYNFVEGLCLVQFNKKRGYIDKNGTEYWED